MLLQLDKRCIKPEEAFAVYDNKQKGLCT